MKTAQHIEKALDPILRQAIGATRLDRISVGFGTDHEGEPAVFITVHLRDGARSARRLQHAKIAGLVHQKLRSLGEERYPYVRFDFGDSAEVVDDSVYARRSRKAG